MLWVRFGLFGFIFDRLEHEKILEEKASLQDDYDNLQEVAKFETDQLKQQLEQEAEAMKTELRVRQSRLLKDFVIQLLV